MFHYRRGVRHGDPLSPLLFVLSANLLQTVLNSARRNNLLALPLPLPSDDDFPILQYVDDTLIFMQGDVNQLQHLKEILHSFAETTGLQVNFEKSFMVPINVTEERLNILASTLGCSKQSLPLPIWVCHLASLDHQLFNYGLNSKCERRLVAFSSFLTEASRLQLTNVVITALPTFAMYTYLLPKIVTKQIDKLRKHCLWRGSDLNNRKSSKAAWLMVCVPKPEGGLGVLDLKIQTENLLRKHLHKFFNRMPVPWVQLVWDYYYFRLNLPTTSRTLRGSFWWKDILKLLDSYKGITRINLQSGSTYFLWFDLWDDRVHNQSYPKLFSYAKS